MNLMRNRLKIIRRPDKRTARWIGITALLLLVVVTLILTRSLGLSGGENDGAYRPKREPCGGTDGA